MLEHLRGWETAALDAQVMQWTPPAPKMLNVQCSIAGVELTTVVWLLLPFCHAEGDSLQGFVKGVCYFLFFYCIIIFMALLGFPWLLNSPSVTLFPQVHARSRSDFSFCVSSLSRSCVILLFSWGSATFDTRLPSFECAFKESAVLAIKTCCLTCMRGFVVIEGFSQPCKIFTLFSK